jgi:hypothetical protein
MKKQFDDTYIDVNDEIIKEANELYLKVILLDLNENDKEYIESMNIFINNNKKYRSKLINNYLDFLRKLIE